MKIHSRNIIPFAILMVVVLSAFTNSFAKDKWLQVNSKNFMLIGNANEKDIRKAATKLEQFREGFRLAFPSATLTSPVPTNVIVFKSDSDFRPFKPVDGAGKPNDSIAGYFLATEEVNYIALSASGTEADMYGTIFHEYVHFIINAQYGSGNVPRWFNEGIAEYYQTFEIKDDQIIKLGLPQAIHLRLLQQARLIPLKDFFRLSYRNIGGGHSQSIFYAQSWATVHYMIQSGKLEGLSKFIGLTMDGKPQEEAFNKAFGMTYAEMEKELQKYINKRSFNYHELKLREKLVVDAELRVAPLSEADSNYFLGDLLYRNQRFDAAEPFLAKAVSLDSSHSNAFSSLGMVKMRQRKYTDAKRNLDRAVELNPANHLALYRYAYLISREGRDEFGMVREFPPDEYRRMTELLRKAIAEKPDFTESHDLFGFISQVNKQDLDDALKFMQQASRLQPGNDRYKMRIAELQMEMKKFDEAETTAKKLADTAEDDAVRARAESLVGFLKRVKEAEAYNAEVRRQIETITKSGSGTGSSPDSGPPRLGRRTAAPDLEKKAEDAVMREMNRALRPPADGEIRMIGSIQKVECKGMNVTYTIQTDEGNIQLTSKGFDELIMTAFTESSNGIQMGCGASIGSVKKVITYKPTLAAAGRPKGELIAIDFVPANFRFVDEQSAVVDDDEEEKEPTVIVSGPPPPPRVISSLGSGEPQDIEAVRRKMILDNIRENLTKPEAGEKRGFGTLEKSECTSKAFFIFVRTKDGVLKFSVKDNSPQLRAYTPEVENVQFGCGMKALDIPMVFVFKDAPNKKDKSQGELRVMEFVPRSFTLEN
ncbi:MAG: tetratricopeptide repeat protein [Acidobacteria bacterium]|nr:tetratricopeptide repeat protein [Acidobacteriota bacterium]